MKYLLLTFLLLPALSLAASYEEEDFRGIAPDGEAVQLDFRSEWSDVNAGRHYYGTDKISPLRFCDLKRTNANEDLLQCSSEKDGTPTAEYSACASLSDPSAQHAMASYPPEYHIQKFIGSRRVFVCTKGCRDGVPALLVENIQVEGDPDLPATVK